MGLLEVNRFGRLPASVSERELVYPAEFHFRILAEAESAAEAALGAAVAPYRVTAPLAFSRGSSGGRYRAYSVSVQIENREELLAFDAAVKRVPGVRMVL
ncbi:MAG: DUF493 family protein [Kiritimatiellae bacterium]|nr:DUF493 family protein [Kiritimatiellia bacterium]